MSYLPKGSQQMPSYATYGSSPDSTSAPAPAGSKSNPLSQVGKTADQLAKEQACWPRLNLRQKKDMISAFECIRMVEAEMRHLLGNPNFRITFDAHHAFCERGEDVKKAILKNTHYSKKEVEALSNDVGRVAEFSLPWMANEHGTTDPYELSPYTWRGLLGETAKAVKDDLQKEVLNGCFDHFHVAFDEPNCNDELHFAQDGKSLIYVINAHCQDANNCDRIDYDAGMYWFVKLGGVAQTPREIHEFETKKVSPTSVVITRPAAQFK